MNIFSGIVVFDSSWVIGCCGAVVQWEMNCYGSDTMVLQVWRPINHTAHQYLLVGEIQESGR